MIDTTPETEIRTDLWLTMTTSELDNQLSIVINKIAAIQELMTVSGYTPSLQLMLGALQQASTDLHHLISHKSDKV